METVSFTPMDRGTAADWRIVMAEEEAYRAGFADRLLELFHRGQGIAFAHKLTNHRHGLQAATRALRDGADKETVVAALLHGVGEVISAANHAEVSAALLRPYLGDENAWLVRWHALVRGYCYFHLVGRDRDARDRFASEPAYRRTVDVCERRDQVSFDPAYDTLPNGAFEPMVRRVLSRPPRSCA
jgi:predicted HD phosphohydrolase